MDTACFLHRKTGRKVNILFLLQARMKFSAERATSLSNPESLKKEVCVRVCGWDFITAYSAIRMMVSKPSLSAFRVDSVTPEWLWKWVRVMAHCQLKKSENPFVSDQSKTTFLLRKAWNIREFPFTWIQNLVLCRLYDLASIKTGTAESYKKKKKKKVCRPYFKTWHNEVMTGG